MVVWSVGRIRWGQRSLTTELTETTAQLAAERNKRAELAVATERIRITRQLHGFVARGVVSMVVQTETARSLLIHEPASAASAIRAIEQNGRDALTQLRRILGVLRSTSGPLVAPAAATPTQPEPHTREDSARLPEHALA